MKKLLSKITILFIELKFILLSWYDEKIIKAYKRKKLIRKFEKRFGKVDRIKYLIDYPNNKTKYIEVPYFYKWIYGKERFNSSNNY